AAPFYSPISRLPTSRKRGSPTLLRKHKEESFPGQSVPNLWQPDRLIMALHSILLAVGLGFLFYRYILYPAFISPLSKIPASHPLAPILPFWLTWKAYTGCQARSIFDAHR